ncbi:MAG: cell division protein FtsK [Dactylosporangium sp.]|nr:cell division protein FtsK [Dactylosporangium sp.]NNJ62707.1 cell division protein FtsK [Dactylosporangium sp.]
MPDIRANLVAAVRQRIARARGIAQAERERAEQRSLSAKQQVEKIRHSAVDTVAASAAERDRKLAEAAARHATVIINVARHADTAALQATLAATDTPDEPNPEAPADGTAPGAAGLAWDRWSPTAIEVGQVAPPVRIGHVLLRGIEVPALVSLLDRGHILLTGSSRSAIDGVLLTLLMRSLGTVPFGSVHLFGYDPEHLGGRLAAFAPLAGARLLSFAGPRGLTSMLDGLVDEAHRISQKVLAGEHASLRERAARGHGRPEPWRVAVLLGDGTEPTVHERAQIRRLLRTGVACGIHVIICDLPFEAPDRGPGRSIATVDVTTINIDAVRAIVDVYPLFHVVLDDPPALPTVTDLSRSIADHAIIGPPPTTLARLLPDRDKIWTSDSTEGITTPIGEDASGRPVQLSLSDHPPHALIGGPTGSGKTNFIYAWLAGLASRYSPDELELYLLDFKEGVSFARFAPTARDSTWLPHVRLVGLNVNTDREFGVALLRYLGEELRRRAEAAKSWGVTKLAELRQEDPDGRWPRIIAVIDEFQVLFGARDALTNQAVELLEDLARRGRSQGIHLVLASQDVSGIEALWGRSALLAQLTLRVALPKARRVLIETNPAADEVPRYHAVVNTDSGVTSANQIVRIPNAGDRAAWHELLLDLTARSLATPSGQRRPRVFDGDAVPSLDEAPDFLALRPTARARARSPRAGGRAGTPIAILGEAVDVAARSASVALGRSPGRNIAVLGTSAAEARSVLDASARSLARQYDQGEARFSVALLDGDTHPAIGTLRTALPPDTEWFDRDSVPDLLSRTVLSIDEQPDTPHFLLLYAVDAAARQLAARGPHGTGHDLLRQLLHLGPERHTHLIGWWRAVARLRDDLGGITARFDPIGAWVALDVHGNELSALSPTGAPRWYPRPWRALFFDRRTHRTSEVMIPYREFR